MTALVTLTRDPERIRALFATFFTELFADPALRQGFAGVNKVVEMRYSDPEIVFLLDLRGDSPAYIDTTGTPAAASDIQIEMAWETAHDFWKDDLDVIMAFISQRIKASGATEALLELRPHFKSAARLYNDLASRLLADGEPA